MTAALLPTGRLHHHRQLTILREIAAAQSPGERAWREQQARQLLDYDLADLDLVLADLNRRRDQLLSFGRGLDDLIGRPSPPRP